MANTYLQYLLDKSCALHLPVSGTMELTARCNFRCRMCYIHRSSADRSCMEKEQPLSYWTALADRLKEAGTLTVLLTGGEPLLRPDFEELYRYLKKSGFLVTVNTNLSLVTERHLRLFADCKPLALNVSLYGGSEETYRRLCGVEGMYETVRRNLLLLKERNVNIKLNYTVTEENYADRELIHAFAAENGFPVQQTTYMFPPVRSMDKSAVYCRPGPERSAEMLFSCEQCKYGAHFPEFLASHRSDSVAEECGTDAMRCRAGVSSFWVTYDGRLQLCGMMDSPSVPLETREFSSCWEQAKAYRNAIRLPGGCANCPDREYCEICAAVCHAEGSFETPPDYLCRKAREYRRMAEAFMKERQNEVEQ